MEITSEQAIVWGRQAILQEAKGLVLLAETLSDVFFDSINCILNCQGKIIVAGMGKSGHVGKKIVATLASTGTPAMFVHPAEASHGDLGMIETRDVVIAISKSGESPELGDILHYCRRFGIPVIAMTADSESSLGKAATYVLLLPSFEEVCPLGLAPTTSTTMMLAMGDALAIVCMQARDFQPTQFREFHPGGKLGQKLTRVRDVMSSGVNLPIVIETARVSDAILEMSRGRFGCVGIVDADNRLIGIFTDGDLRRHFNAANLDRLIMEVMTHRPYQIDANALIADVAYLFTEKRIPSVFVCQNDQPVGIVHVHDLLQKGFV